jgi:hypothetical protein
MNKSGVNVAQNIFYLAKVLAWKAGYPIPDSLSRERTYLYKDDSLEIRYFQSFNLKTMAIWKLERVKFWRIFSFTKKTLVFETYVASWIGRFSDSSPNIYIPGSWEQYLWQICRGWGIADAAV